MDRNVSQAPYAEVDLSDQRSVSRLSRTLLARMSRDEAVESLVRMVTPDDSEPPPALLLEIVRLAGVKEATGHLGAEYRLQAGQVGRSIQEVLASPENLPASANSIAHLSDAEINLGAALAEPPTVVHIDKCDVPSLDVPSFWASPIFEADPRLRATVDRMKFREPALRERAWRDEQLTFFQEYALLHGSIDINDIYTGGPARYAGCFIHWDRFIYRFQGLHTQYLVCGMPMGRVEGLYLPHENIILSTKPAQTIAVSTWTTLLARMAKAMIDAREPAPSASHAVTVRTGGAENFAHHLWNYYGAIERALQLGSLQNAAAIQHVGSEFFGPLESVFPELDALPVHKVPRSRVDSSGLFDATRVTVPLGTGLLFHEAMDRIIRLAEGRPLGPRAQETARSMSAFSTIIYVALRVGDKSWIDADRELPRLIEQFIADHPDACFVLDGYAYPSGVDHVSTRWTKQINELAALAGIVRKRTRYAERVFSIVEMDMLESIALMRMCTLYISPLGSAHHKVDWLHDLPGIVYVSPDFAGASPNNWPGMKQRLGASPLPEVLLGKETETSNVRVRGSRDGRTRLSNMSIAAEDLLYAVGRVLNPYSDDRETGAMMQQLDSEPLRNSGVLRAIHASLRPRTYLEVGVRNGCSLALSSAKSIGIDPVPNITSEIKCEYAFEQSTSDEYFANNDPTEYLGGTIDFALIDGLHLFEFALRDFINVEKYCTWTSVVVIDDILPRSPKEGSRTHEPGPWAGDVYWLPFFLRKYRPDLIVAALDTQPTGVAIVTGLDPSSRELEQKYEEIMAEFRDLAEGGVPDWVLSRTHGLPPREVLRRMPWDLLRAGNASADDPGSATLVELRTAMAEIAAPAES